MEGKKRRVLLERFKEKLPFDSPRKKREFLFQHLLRSIADVERPRMDSRPKAIRAALYSEAAASCFKPEIDHVLEVVSERLGIKKDQILTEAFADLSLERKVFGIPKDFTPEFIQLDANLTLVKSLVARSAEVEIRAHGNIRQLVRHAKFRRLICHVSESSPQEGPSLEISGPLSIFGHTLVYGKALSELVPMANWCNSFQMAARCRIRGKEGILELKKNDPILPSPEPRLFDSRLEERFSKEFSAIAADWDIVREPDPIRIPDSLIFPDFLIKHRRQPERNYYIEIVGFWTPDYLRKKFDNLKAAHVSNLIILVDQALGCAGGPEFSLGKEILFFKRRIDPRMVLEKIQSDAFNR